MILYFRLGSWFEEGTLIDFDSTANHEQEVLEWKKP
jgi:hypothetical protein